MTATLPGRVRSGFAWSMASNIVLRIGSLAIGIILARLLAPEVFGVYAVALTAQSILMAIADPGLTAVLIRTPDFGRLAPTTATLGLFCGVGLASVMAATSPLIADAMETPAASPVIGVLSLTLALAGIGVVPLARLQRDFAQKKVFAISAADFTVSTIATITLVLAGVGPMALAVGRVLGQAVTTALQFVLARQRPVLGWDRAQAAPVLAFGAPLACANLVSWVVISADNVVIARMAGPTALGLYVLAFNIASWPMNALGQAVRAVALPGFAQSEDASRAFQSAVTLTWAAAAGAGALIAALAGPVIAVLYGDAWARSGPILAALAVFGAMRTVFDVVSGYLMARGRSRAVLMVQMTWCVVLVPALIIGIQLDGATGAGWAHVVVGVVVLGVFGAVLRGAGVRRMVRASVYPTVVAAGAGAVSIGVVAVLSTATAPAPIVRLAAGGVAGGLVLIAGLSPWALPRIRASQMHGTTLRATPRPNVAEGE
ncbi:oligosaccharide flippase family protein [Sinomonas sp. R1AF57]|uniref:oligosaccharide flippase family protein n=1 Tax=Sinomonas sp. R1AF57 TaxID=2020377 RepID=UPI001ABFEB64|nr:oligosaccharide flippase family protein [Sinomonas sp. R1AF57]